MPASVLSALMPEASLLGGESPGGMIFIKLLQSGGRQDELSIVAFLLIRWSDPSQSNQISDSLSSPGCRYAKAFLPG